jgi:hypothetical protein
MFFEDNSVYSIFSAIREKKIEKVKEMINAKERNINTLEDFLYEAVSVSSIPIVDFLIDDKGVEINKIREFGLEKLTNYISLTDPGAENIIKEIESDIFSFSSKNYTFNIKKIIFLFDNFPEKMEDIILSKRNGNTTGQSNITELLVYETPYNLEAEKIGNVKTDEEKQSKIAELLEWKPNLSNYDNYKDELSESNHDFKKFRKSHPELKNIELNEIMSEYAEKIQWENFIKDTYLKIENEFSKTKMKKIAHSDDFERKMKISLFIIQFRWSASLFRAVKKKIFLIGIVSQSNFKKLY